jgi:hypothetical protein
MPRLRRAVLLDGLPGLRRGILAQGLVQGLGKQKQRRRARRVAVADHRAYDPSHADAHATAAARHAVILLKVRAAVFCVVAAVFAALFIFITARRALEGDVTGTIYAAALSVGLTWMTVRTYRRFQRS